MPPFLVSRGLLGGVGEGPQSEKSVPSSSMALLYGTSKSLSDTALGPSLNQKIQKAFKGSRESLAPDGRKTGNASALLVLGNIQTNHRENQKTSTGGHTCFEAFRGVSRHTSTPEEYQEKT